MKQFRKQLPPLSALLAFEAAARTQNFTRAGSEMNVTQAAISRQIAVLERFLGVRVFRRLPRGMLLTNEGHALYSATDFALQHLANAVKEIMRGTQPAAISVYTTIAFAYFWLMPRLPRFREKFPGTSIQVISSDQDFDIYKDHCDAAILFGSGSWPGMEAKLLYQECISAVASPSYLRRQRKFRTVDDLTRGTLLHLEDEKRRWIDWPQWLRKMGARSTNPGDSLYFNNYPTLLQAAANGQGIALGWHGLITDKLVDKAIVEVLPSRLTSDQGYYVAHSSGSSARPEVNALIDWITEEALTESRLNTNRRKTR